MTLDEGFLLIIRWAHHVSALAWTGGGVFYLIIIRPILTKPVRPSTTLRTYIGEGIGNLLEICMMVLLITGMVLTLARLTTVYADLIYATVLGIKIIFSLWVFWLVLIRRRIARQRGWNHALGLLNESSSSRRAGKFLTGDTAMVGVSIVIVLLADVLRLLVEQRLVS